MNFSLGGVTRGFLVIMATLLFSVSLSACSDDAAPLDTTAKTTATPDPKTADEAAVKNLTDQYWRAVVEAENTANPDPAQFKDVAKGSFIESELRRLRAYEAADIRRVGKPDITALEATVTGATADIRACVNQNSWSAEHDGKKVPAPNAGPLPWGAEASRLHGVWLVTDVRVPPKGSKQCP